MISSMSSLCSMYARVELAASLQASELRFLKNCTYGSTCDEAAE